MFWNCVNSCVNADWAFRNSSNDFLASDGLRLTGCGSREEVDGISEALVPICRLVSENCGRRTSTLVASKSAPCCHDSLMRDRSNSEMS